MNKDFLMLLDQRMDYVEHPFGVYEHVLNLFLFLLCACVFCSSILIEIKFLYNVWAFFFIDNVKYSRCKT